MFFLIFSNANILFSNQKLIWRFYIVTKSLPTTKKIELIDKKKSAKVALNKNVEVFGLYITSPTLVSIPISLGKNAQIVLLIAQEMKILAKYLDFLNVFSNKKALVLFELTKLNYYSIKLRENNQLLYKPIYSLGLIELKFLKIYIEINLANNFFWPSNLLVGALIFFV